SAFGCTTADYMRRHSVSTQIEIGARADDAELAETANRVNTIWQDLEKAAVDEMLADGHAREKVRTMPFLMMRYTGQLEDVEVMSTIPAVTNADDMQKVINQFEAVYAKINHRVSRYGEAGFSITELGLIATADKVKPVLVKRSLGASDPGAAHKGTREAYSGGHRQTAHLKERDVLAPSRDEMRPASV